ncbi:NUDIX domain-containing protein [Arthrobacter gengyunqii]|uniref:NUDIX domain-containing protein n=1 Tax=Arthrobacter gengyunqii TaxID=2886940 RepID=A0A9X1M0M2_9MICC|nr:NUDIX domain-containing protein [Arthrobacter gengyunqii]MCC3268745.1 NUDIX domain-containing protein [Arthrobacter gengyunqii]UOY96129.1 NUDIX domain-containing protein [Arthrobacter gengyunqii]
MGHIGSYVWELRQKVGNRQLLLPGAQVLVLRTDGTALLQRRVDNGVWELPAGACEPGQSFVGAAVAELFEETGIRADPGDLVAFASLSDPDLHQLEYPNGDRVHAFALCFCLTGWEGSVIPEQSEVAEIGFFPLTRIPEPVHPPTREVLQLYAQYLRTGAFQAR